MTLRRLYHVPLPDLGARVDLAPAEARYLRDVLRLGPGDRVALFGEGPEERIAEIVRCDREGVALEARESRAARTESPLRLTLGAALLKGGRTEAVIEKATELGVTEIVLYASARAVPRVSAADAPGKLARWRKIAEGAARQCGRTDPPALRLLSFADMLRALAAARGPRVFYWESAAPGAPEPEAGPEAAVVTGPEGGFTADEAEAARAQGFAIRGLGPRILRAETAAVLAVALAQGAWGDLHSSA